MGSEVSTPERIDEKNTNATDKKTEYFNDKTLRYSDHIYKSNIHTATLFKTDFETHAPVIDSTGSVTLKFDDFDPNVKTYNYALIHCNHDWQPSGLLEAEYLEGFFQGNITQYEHSFNTLQNYVNYSLTVPNDDLKIKLSGNYILYVYENNDKNDPVLTRRFMLYENRVAIHPEIKRTANAEERNYKQEVDFNISLNGITINNSFADLKVYLLQNYRWDNAISGLQPKYVQGNQLVYDMDEPQNFNGGNEYRNVNLNDLRLKSARVWAINHDSTLFNAILYKDERFAYKGYISRQDINGNFITDRAGSTERYSEADYLWATFSLDYSERLTGSDIYIFGELTDWKIDKRFKMKYDESKGYYTGTVLLKQGFYDYIYVKTEDNTNKIDDTFIEGTHFETENDYVIFVYYRDLRVNADLLVGCKEFSNYR